MWLVNMFTTGVEVVVAVGSFLDGPLYIQPGRICLPYVNKSNVKRYIISHVVEIFVMHCYIFKMIGQLTFPTHAVVRSAGRKNLFYVRLIKIHGIFVSIVDTESVWIQPE